GDVVEPVRGGMLRIIENMEASLSVPTATSVREIPVRALEENRALVNRHRATMGAPKVSFTHIIAWAMIKALDTFPRLNDAYAEIDGKAHRIHRGDVRLGVAVDVQKKDGSRTLLVPNIRGANQLSFPEFLEKFDNLVGRSRRNQLMPDDFMGTTVSLTNPGTVGTTASTPRLMPGQGLILATGSLDYPPEFRSMAQRTLSMLGISKVMTVTSTYDHRVIQGAESGLFLARIEALLRGDDRFYERLFEDLAVPYPPVRTEVDAMAPGLMGGAGGNNKEEVEKQARVLQLIHAFRVRGHLLAQFDPLGVKRPAVKDLDPGGYGLTLWDLDREFFTNGALGKEKATLREIIDVMRETYCNTVTSEYMFIAATGQKEWLQNRQETSRNKTDLSPVEKKRVMEKLAEAEAFERHLHTKYVGHKRFSLEGLESTIPLLDELLSLAARAGVADAVLGMAHRGRLNVLANVLEKPLPQIFAEFEGSTDPDETQGSGDVKYHLGATSVHKAPDGNSLSLELAPNPSHLEFVNPVVEGMIRAKQDLRGDRTHVTALPILLHGDAAFAGQGVVAETLNLAGLSGYRTGGTIHIVTNNQIGFTTLPEDARSSTYCTDVAKMVAAPVFHVNADDPDGVIHVARMAFEFQRTFKHDVVIDLVGYRRWGHNEGDEPAYTQPTMYARIKNHPSVATIYGDKLVKSEVMTREELEIIWATKRALMQQTEGGALPEPKAALPEPPDVDPSALSGRLQATLQGLTLIPAGFEPHPKLLPFLKKRADLLEGRGKGEVDWATAESLAFGTLLLEGVSVRLSGQDVGRGTFSQRHAILYDHRDAREFVPLQQLAAGGSRFDVYDSLLSECAVMGFEFGYSAVHPRALVMWEAQFGDFVNGAQVIVDQFLAATEQKWNQPVGLTLLLPHGHEGQGPEHSSGRIERFLTLCAENNLRVAYPSTPASFFHLLRAQGRSGAKKPLVVFTPKSLLRAPYCVSSLADLAQGRFLPVLADTTADPAMVRRVVITSGKVSYDLMKERDARGARDVAIVRLERYYPFPAAELSAILRAYPVTAEIAWAQEEPSNMGPWRFIRERFLDGEVPGFEHRWPSYIGRDASASPAPGSHKVHTREQEELVAKAFQ
ncbi:MAG: multifunctional oxoglutarate decarboxylase/oxoglutarate dehydrogenase thiamine pyrophosphate-binding subunit/dihydrolipoyllysine-residue succinyltransferase subunit, partial [Vicinamibacteria bacterium]|nr:multifunctional oxoglutarate decarboxylase/oxoglutarate dehydrogenase thiamine pyrophosphate-binding subunit/dihydrolipoyllysine-residue succinyltransferase subunit [Vicinamibacteria bacterium]